MKNINELEKYILSNNVTPIFICGDSFGVLKNMPSDSIDCILTSPPYYQKRQYLAGGIGLENTYEEYIDNLLKM